MNGTYKSAEFGRILVLCILSSAMSLHPASPEVAQGQEPDIFVCSFTCQRRTKLLGLLVSLLILQLHLDSLFLSLVRLSLRQGAFPSLTIISTRKVAGGFPIASWCLGSPGFRGRFFTVLVQRMILGPFLFEFSLNLTFDLLNAIETE
jgi:hypothetical protein